jgi:hypothetical protein
VQQLIGSRAINKIPAYSTVEVNGEVSLFVADDQTHPWRFEIWDMLQRLAHQMEHKTDEEEETLFQVL